MNLVTSPIPYCYVKRNLGSAGRGARTIPIQRFLDIEILKYLRFFELLIFGFPKISK